MGRAGYLWRGASGDDLEELDIGISGDAAIPVGAAGGALKRCARQFGGVTFFPAIISMPTTPDYPFSEDPLDIEIKKAP